ncbi:MAG: DUF3291 domain-containing protein [Acidobacteria bacterium]|nr:DUF3291 domain-containing protein [Acidobacteriota bacterium]
MAFVSVTRLRIRSVRFMPAFVVYAFRSRQQAREAPGFVTGALLHDREMTFWTMTIWDAQESMRGFMTSGAHKQVMPRLLNWCDEASVVHWSQPEATLPSWAAADARMRATGRPSKVLHPSPRHASLSYREPRTAAGAIIK